MRQEVELSYWLQQLMTPQAPEWIASKNGEGDDMIRTPTFYPAACKCKKGNFQCHCHPYKRETNIGFFILTKRTCLMSL